MVIITFVLNNINKMKNLLLAIIVISMLVSCKKQEETVTAQKVVDRAVAEAGGNLFEQSIVSFDFRGRHYEAWRYKGAYVLNRFSQDSVASVCDELSNKGFRRFINADEVVLADSISSKYRQSVNSVHYFAMLPFGLNDAAVNKEYLGESTIKGTPYQKIRVSFAQESGGDDFEDVFLYWVNKNTHYVDYLAYEYHTNEGGMRFREAFNARTVNGLRFVDYNNYKPKNKDIPFEEIADYFNKGELQLLSKIILENVAVTPIDGACSSC